jgi:poly(3-hydroxybutyrate) depolymerase
VPVIAFHGTADPIVIYEGGGLNAARIADVDYWKGNVPPGLPLHHGVDAAMQTWAKRNGCDAKPFEERVAPEVRRRTWQHCKADTILYAIDGGGHAWPGKPVPQRSVLRPRDYSDRREHAHLQVSVRAPKDVTVAAARPRCAQGWANDGAFSTSNARSST